MYRTLVVISRTLINPASMSHTDLSNSLTCRTYKIVMLAQRRHVETFFCDAVMMPEVKVVCSDTNDTLKISRHL